MTRFRVYPYKQGSASAKKLAEALGGKVLRRERSRYVPRRGDVVVAWGSSVFNKFAPATTLNAYVEVAHCKLKTLDRLVQAGVRTPPHWTAKGGGDQTFPVVCRTKLRGHSGAGIVIANNPEELVDAPLYTKYIKKKHEYRVHVLMGKPFLVQRKARKTDNDNPNWRVRNLAGGFVFARCDVDEVPPDVINQAVAATLALRVDFGGVDVIWNEKEGKAYVLELNTACGLEDQTATYYRDAILDFVDGYRRQHMG